MTRHLRGIVLLCVVVVSGCFLLSPDRHTCARDSDCVTAAGWRCNPAHGRCEQGVVPAGCSSSSSSSSSGGSSSSSSSSSGGSSSSSSSGSTSSSTGGITGLDCACQLACGEPACLGRHDEPNDNPAEATAKLLDLTVPATTVHDRGVIPCSTDEDWYSFQRGENGCGNGANYDLKTTLTADDWQSYTMEGTYVCDDGTASLVCGQYGHLVQTDAGTTCIAAQGTGAGLELDLVFITSVNGVTNSGTAYVHVARHVDGGVNCVPSNTYYVLSFASCVSR